MKPPKFYEKYLPLKLCEGVEIETGTKKHHVYLKGYFYYDNNHDNPAYDYTWAFVKIPEVSQPVKIRGL